MSLLAKKEGAPISWKPRVFCRDPKRISCADPALSMLQIQHLAATAAGFFMYYKAQKSLASSQPSWISYADPSLSMLQFQNLAATAADFFMYY